MKAQSSDECLNREVFGTLKEARVIIYAGGTTTTSAGHTARRSVAPRAEAAARCQTPLRPQLATLNDTSTSFDCASEHFKINNNPRTLKLHS